MTVNEALHKARQLRPGVAIEPQQLLDWLNDCEGKIQTEVLLMRKQTVRYSLPEDEEEPLLATEPYSDLYVQYLLTQIDAAMAEESRYNDDLTRFNERQAQYQKYILREYDPKHNPLSIRRSCPTIIRGQDAKIQLANMPVAAEDVAEAVLTILQGENEWNFTVIGSTPWEDSSYVEKVMTVDLPGGFTETMAAGNFTVTYSVEDGNGTIWVPEAEFRYYAERGVTGAVPVSINYVPEIR